MAEGLGSGLSRRRVLQGTAWSVPAVVIATAVPARATSLDPGEGIWFITFQPQWTQWFWDNTAGANTTAVTIAATLQNKSLEGGVSAGNITSFVYTVVIPVGVVGNPPAPTQVPRWGLGSNSQGIADGTGFSLVGEPTLADGKLTLTFVWAGTLASDASMYVMVWAEADNDQLGKVASGTAAAQHQGGNTSSDFRTGVTAMILDVSDWLKYFHDPYESPDPPLQPQDSP